MKVKELIRQLQDFDPEARVYSDCWMGEGKDEILCCYYYRRSGDVILQNITQFDIEEELKEMLDYFYTENIDEVDAYTQMCDIGYTPDVVAEFYSEDVGQHMKEYCDEHGIDYPKRDYKYNNSYTEEDLDMAQREWNLEAETMIDGDNK